MSGHKEKRIKVASLRKKMLLVFTLLIIVTGSILFFFSGAVYRYSYAAISRTYLEDVTEQTTNNIENFINSIEDINLQILTNSVIQNQLQDVNQNDMNSFELRNASKLIERELEPYVLATSNVVSMSVVSLNEMVFSVNKVTGRGIDFAFSTDEIYQANGTSIWSLVGPEQSICIAKAILDLKTMKPIGYINMVYEAEYLDSFLRNDSTEYSGMIYLVDALGTIVSTTHDGYVGESFPMDIKELESSEVSSYDILNEKESFYYVGNVMPNGWTLVKAVAVEDFYRRTNQIMGASCVALCVILIFGIATVQLASKRLIQPTQDLLESMKKFGKGDLSQRVKVSEQDEVGQIGEEYNRMADNIETLIEQVYKMEITQKQAEIDFLSMQINPHFLYNTLDTISWMAIAQEGDKVSELTIALADLLRAMVKKERFITLEEELKTVRDYLFIQKQRFGDKISVEYDIDERAYSYRVPNFLFQPLIENAIIHGIEPKIEPGKLMIQIKVEEKSLFFNISDDGVGMSPEEKESLLEQCDRNDTKKNIGLKNVYRRLILCYGEESRLKIISEKNQGTAISFRLPIE
ncbi:cache domain-containing sensor histidine kinase [Ohessyouella blattaphilus]|uniref:Sensor histidine kinase n=1 Tax=Ohessyouella blattaphilus TaxID=2949333 RepID=A0ABT1EIL0_9FIRM|nr:sensor histidine kinase [Ohessyouella blattaphilus]MCP1110543.1 sensor histidine kinase [Ohessyouella blattaphilus]MCR8563937.1 sensor histidine kinase [Ohessyouella blattaphilus]